MLQTRYEIVGYCRCEAKICHYNMDAVVYLLIVKRVCDVIDKPFCCWMPRDCREIEPEANALDDDTAEKLWNESLRLCNI